jgi:hypothetical protein
MIVPDMVTSAEDGDRIPGDNSRGFAIADFLAGTTDVYRNVSDASTQNSLVASMMVITSHLP